MEPLLIWIACGILTAVVATNKGRSGYGWFLLGVLLGPFGFILALVVPKNQPAVEQKTLESGNVKKCPYCAELIRSEAIKCRFCGSELSGDSLERSNPRRSKPPASSARGKPLPAPVDHDWISSRPPTAGREVTVAKDAWMLEGDKAPRVTGPRVKAGTRAVVISTVGAWVRVRTSDGEHGFVLQQDVREA